MSQRNPVKTPSVRRRDHKETSRMNSSLGARKLRQPAPLPKPEAEQNYIDKLSHKEVEDRFEEMLGKSNLSKEKKLPLRGLPNFKKKKMLVTLATGISLDTISGARKSVLPPRLNSRVNLKTTVQEKHIEQLGGEELGDKIEEVATNLNLNEDSHLQLLELSVVSKTEMLVTDYKRSQESGGAFERPCDYISYLAQPDLSVNKAQSCVESLQIALTHNALSWLHDFGAQGLVSVLRLLGECYARNDLCYDGIQHECLRCIRALMNNTDGIKQVFSHKEALTTIARSLDPSKEAVMLETLKILAPVCLIPPDGHERVVTAITESCTMRNPRTVHKTSSRFGPVIQGLTNTGCEPLRVASMILINAMVIFPDDLDTRRNLRDEFMRSGLSDILETLEKDASKDLSQQLSDFKEYEEEDEIELAGRT